jgi:pimeloyl-ACP methyl ester carboxylesterase
MGVNHRIIETNGIRMHLAESGSGPTIVLCHGFPECWHSWRHQITALAQAGFHVVAPDMRGYGQSDAPKEIEQYTIFHVVGDVIGLLDALNVQGAVIVGHDWGAPVARHCALMRPDRIRGVVGLSVPFFPRTPTRPSLAMPREGDSIFYQLHFCDGSKAEIEFERDVRRTLRDLAWLWSGNNPDESADSLSMVRKGRPMFEGRGAPSRLPSWITEDDIDIYVRAFKRSGFSGPLNWYRNIDRNWELTAAWTDATISVPALYMVGERDLLLKFKGMNRLLPMLETFVPNLIAKTVVPQCGHWIQRERPEAVNTALLQFLAGISRG